MDLSVKLGPLRLVSPLLAASGPLSGDAEKVLWLGEQGVGAVITRTVGTAAACFPRPFLVGGKDSLRGAGYGSEFTAEQWLDDHLPRIRKISHTPLLVSVGESDSDLRVLVPLLDPWVDGFEVPARGLGHDRTAIARTVEALRSRTDKPLFVKVGASLPDPAALVRTVLDAGATGISALDAVGPALGFDAARRIVVGNPVGESWLSGPAIKPLALAMVRRIRQAVPECLILGGGGVQSADDVVEFLLAGATAVTLLSGALLKGKDLYAKITAALPAALQKYGVDSPAAATAAGSLPWKVNYDPRVPAVDKATCSRCGLCEKVCPWFAMTVTKGSAAKVDPRKCVGCGLCESRCPTGAISGVLS